MDPRQADFGARPLGAAVTWAPRPGPRAVLLPRVGLEREGKPSDWHPRDWLLAAHKQKEKRASPEDGNRRARS